MSENVKNIESYNELVRYRNNKMDAEERYAFEKALERDPFLSEALDGFSEFKMSDIEHDLKSIHIVEGNNKKKIRPIVYWLVAASVMVLVVSSILFMGEQQPYDLFVENSQEAEPELVLPHMEQPTIDTFVNQVDTLKQFVAEVVKDEPIKEEKELVANLNKAQKIKVDTSKKETEVSKRKEKPMVLAASRMAVNDSSNDAMTPVAAILRDTVKKQLVKMPILVDVDDLDDTTTENDQVNEVVEFNETELAEKRMGADAKPIPLGGKDLYKVYIEDNIKYPVGLEGYGREVVRIEFVVSKIGNPSDFVVLRAPENNEFQEEAIRLIRTGPKWSPAVKDGLPVADKVILRVIFKP